MEKKTNAREWAQIFSRIGLITQLGASFVAPPLLLLLGALWLQKRCGTGDWILLCAILAGLISGGCAVSNLIRAELAREKRTEKKRETKTGEQK